MRAGWRTHVKTAAWSAVITSLIWIAAGAWLFADYCQTAGPTDARSSRSAKSEPPLNQNVSQKNQPVPPLQRSTDRPSKSLIIPVAGVTPAELIDTFNQSRASGARRHDAIDISAALGTPVLAAASGTVEKLFLSAAGGNTIYIRSPDRKRIYYYAHLDSYTRGLTEGQAVQQGQQIGTVGYTGNADPSGPHLHFEIWATTPASQWYGEKYILNPYPLLGGR